MVDTRQLFLKLARGASFKKDDPHTRFLFSKPEVPEVEEREKQRKIKKALDFFGNEKEEAIMTFSRKRHSSKGISNSSTKKPKIMEEPEEVQSKEAITDETDSNEEDNEDNNLIEEKSTAVTARSIHPVEGGIKLFSDRDNILKDGATVPKEKRTKKKVKQKLSPLEQKKFKADEHRFRNHIYVSGDDVPDALSSFADIKDRVPLFVLRNLNDMGYNDPTPIQMQTIPLLLEGREILACAPTGSGKTAAFGIPVISHLKAPAKVGTRAIIVCPTRELALQTQREFGRLCRGSGFKIHSLIGRKSAGNLFEPGSNFKIDILVTTPIRLINILSDEGKSINIKNIEWLVFDECDKLFEDGMKGFKKQIADIYTACDHPGIKHALFSATLTTGVEQFCRVHLDSHVRVTVGKINTTADIKQQLLFVGQETGKLLAVRDIIRKGFTPPLLVFVQSVDRAKQLFHELIYDGVNVDVIHSERTQTQRDNIVKSFRAGKIWVLICTDLMGRGIDFKGVNMVINYDFPPNAISYIHRIGRTGRAGQKGEAITFFTEDDSSRLRSIASVMKNSGCVVEDWMLKLKKPSKTARKLLAKKAVKRKDIKTTSKYDLQKSKKRREMIVASKKRKRTEA